MMMDWKHIMELLKDPPKEYRPVPFWSWNDKLNPDFLRWQIGEMEKAGLGGYFMHARGGLQTEYMGAEWMDCVKACIEEGGKYGMDSWFYDEDGWPSGFAGGAVNSLGEEFYSHWLECEIIKRYQITQDKKLLGIFEKDENTNCYIPVSADATNDDAYTSKELMTVSYNSNPYYVDVLDEKVVSEFIKATHEKYYNLFKEHFGKEMPGFFTDEPQYALGKIPWSHSLPQKFKDKYGYNLKDVLPALFVECTGYRQIRYHFWSLINDLYATSFGKQIFDWCNEHNCKLTGHVMTEDSLATQMDATSGCMTFYEYMHIPGMDWLGRKIESPVIPKQVGSVATQLGKKFVISETFALCGWDVSFEEMKWIAEWQYVNGVNLMCQHLEGYTLRGFRKRDYPPSLFFQQPWWEEYRMFNDYFARLGVLLTSGRQAVGVLLLHPMKSAWIYYNGKNNEFIRKLDDDFVKATTTLSNLHIDHHYGDETILRNYGRVERNNLIIGQCSYKTVVIPSMISMDKTTLDLLTRFLDNGGVVISTGDFPTLCSGAETEELVLLKVLIEVVDLYSENQTVQETIIKKVRPNIRISDGKTEISSIHYHQRDLDDRQIYFLVNHSSQDTYMAGIKISGHWHPRLMFADNVEMKEIQYEKYLDSIQFDLKFAPMQSHIIFLDTGATMQTEKKAAKTEKVILGDNWWVEESDLNSLTLDYCSYKIDDNEWAEPVSIMKLMTILLNLKKSCEVALKFNFVVNSDLKQNKTFFLAIETAQQQEINVNNHRIIYSDQGWWKDSAFEKVDIKPYLVNGVNEIILKRIFYQNQRVYEVLFGNNVFQTEKNRLTYDTELESIYLVGDFGVESVSEYTYGDRKAVLTKGPFVITDISTRVKTGDLTQQGFCFFSGKLKISQNITVQKCSKTRLVLDLGRPNAVVIKIYINDKPLKVIPWSPYIIDIQDFVEDGENKISIELFSGNRNLLGPHHHVKGELYAVGPFSYSEETADWSAEDREPDKWRDRYCFVKFGLST